MSNGRDNPMNGLKLGHTSQEEGGPWQRQSPKPHQQNHHMVCVGGWVKHRVLRTSVPNQSRSIKMGWDMQNDDGGNNAENGQWMMECGDGGSARRHLSSANLASP